MQFATEIEFQKELEKIPDFDNYLNCLKDLYNCDKSSLTQKELTKLYFEKAFIIPHFFATMENSTLNSLTSFRARVLHPSEDNTLINTFSYPHPTICKKNGRANIINHPVFYCSDNPLTAILEAKPQIGTEMYLSVWKVNCDREIQYSSFISPKVKETNPWFKHGQHVANFLIEQSKKMQTSREKELNLLLEFNSEIFIKEKDNYPLTSWLANQSLYRIDGIDFIVYPSSETDTRTCNMAFHPNFIDKYFVFDRVYRIRFDGNEDGEISLSVANVGKVLRTHIEWIELTEEDFEMLPNMKKKQQPT